MRLAYTFHTYWQPNRGYMGLVEATPRFANTFPFHLISMTFGFYLCKTWNLALSALLMCVLNVTSFALFKTASCTKNFPSSLLYAPLWGHINIQIIVKLHWFVIGMQLCIHWRVHSRQKFQSNWILLENISLNVQIVEYVVPSLSDPLCYVAKLQVAVVTLGCEFF